ncbi:histidyl-tRNA synthetase [Lachnospiraceae bacterium XBB2008]|nr:histidyl-tRNA synthetase [Lachnospiraceae bacterium XBB2008]
MGLNKKPVTGMKDILPEEMAIREYVMGIIRSTYAEFGFTQIETPCIESLDNLNCKAGGENEKLIFKIMKRGEKLKIAEAKEENDLADGGLRYDLTVPLVRYYSNHSAELPNPFKALQMGNVWRADRPQRGRYRQFMQCDIDILGDASNLAEIELILATTTTLGRIGFRNFEVRINDRRILRALALNCGFPEDKLDEIFIILDKMDKIGTDGVRAELIEAGFDADKVDSYIGRYSGMKDAEDPVSYCLDYLGDSLEEGVADSFKEIISSVKAAGGDHYRLVFDPTLVRGMSYYTGTIFEIAMPEFGGSCGGGGRYDRMVSMFTGQSVPACGFSIGFERIIMLLMESGFKVPGSTSKTAYLVEKGVDSDTLVSVFKEAAGEREKGRQILVVRMNKNRKFQKEQLTAQGYTEFKEFFKEGLK